MSSTVIIRDIEHNPVFNVKKAEELYSKKDGVDVKYVCTTDLRNSDMPVDVFYRATPHPEFGNRYFGLFAGVFSGDLMITNADVVEELEFGMIEHKGTYYYSRSHHDYKVVGDQFIDGGRQYIRSSGNAQVFKVKDGEFQKN